jgi:hypothetical protein
MRLLFRMNTGASVIVTPTIPDTWISSMTYFPSGLSSFSVAGAASLNTVQLFSTIRFPTQGWYNVGIDAAWTRATGAAGQDTHACVGLSSITGTSWSSLPFVNENLASSFTTLNTTTFVSTTRLTKNIVFMDKGNNTYTASLVLGNPRIQYIPTQ